MLISIFILLSLEGQAAKPWEPSGETEMFWNPVELEREII
jgi:hypothetical protein